LLLLNLLKLLLLGVKMLQMPLLPQVPLLLLVIPQLLLMFTVCSKKLELLLFQQPEQPPDFLLTALTLPLTLPLMQQTLHLLLNLLLLILGLKKELTLLLNGPLTITLKEH